MIFKELANHLDLDISTFTGEFKCTILSNRAIFVQNYIKILVYSSEKLTLKLKNKYFIVVGEDLAIKEMGKKEAVVVGKFNSFSYDMV